MPPEPVPAASAAAAVGPVGSRSQSQLLLQSHPGSAPLEIRLGGLDTPEVAALLAEHLADMHRYSPPEAVHALDLERLGTPDLTFWSVWEGSEAVGCGALRELDPTHGEVKSMRTGSAHRRRGVGALVLLHLVAEGRRRGYERLSLETGPQAEFAPARAMYARHGFVKCGPFGPYALDEFSVFMTLDLDGAAVDVPSGGGRRAGDPRRA